MIALGGCARRLDQQSTHTCLQQLVAIGVARCIHYLEHLFLLTRKVSHRDGALVRMVNLCHAYAYAAARILACRDARRLTSALLRSASKKPAVPYQNQKTLLSGDVGGETLLG